MVNSIENLEKNIQAGVYTAQNKELDLNLDNKANKNIILFEKLFMPIFKIYK